MAFSQEEYSKYYIVQALFKLMGEYDYEKISVTDVTAKAGVGRATFYRYFKRKEDVIIYYFEHYKKEFLYSKRFYPRCKADYVETVIQVLTTFKDHMQPFKLIRKARLEYIYLDYLNKRFSETFKKDYPEKSKYLPFLYAGMLFNVSISWLDNDCDAPVSELAETIVNSIYFE
ncbi:MAG: TetR/AcrR family transcriptional regulator [Clostridia bacterium]|nr:TetR/AcrR family transcriptional regulator [Clostridia bacterium]